MVAYGTTVLSNIIAIITKLKIFIHILCQHSSLASCVVIYSHVQLHQQSAEPITDNRDTCEHLTWLVNQSQQKQTEQFFPPIHTWIVSSLIWLLNGEKKVLKWLLSLFTGLDF